jgi:hypothetical protein
MMPEVAPPPDFWTWLFSNKAWNEFPVVFLIVACFVLVGLAVRWFWNDYKKEAAADRKWKEEQSAKHETAQNERDRLMREFYLAITEGTKSDIDDMRGVSDRITKALDALLLNYANHDLQAKEIKALVSEIRNELLKLAPKSPAPS